MYMYTCIVLVGCERVKGQITMYSQCIPLPDCVPIGCLNHKVVSNTIVNSQHIQIKNTHNTLGIKARGWGVGHSIFMFN